MTPLDYIRIDADILSRQDLTDKAKMLMGLIKNFNGKGLMMSNPELAKSLGTSTKTISRAISELEDKDLVSITGGQSRYRKIYLDKNGKVDASTGTKMDSTWTNMTPTFPKMSNITKRTERTERDSITPEGFSEHWNSFDRLPTVRAFGKERRDKLAARAKEETFKAHWKEIIRKLSGSSFHTGGNERGWRAGVDWILKNDTNYLKILELPEPFDGVTREATETEIDRLLGTDDDE